MELSKLTRIPLCKNAIAAHLLKKKYIYLYFLMPISVALVASEWEWWSIILKWLRTSPPLLTSVCSTNLPPTQKHTLINSMHLVFITVSFSWIGKNNLSLIRNISFLYKYRNKTSKRMIYIYIILRQPKHNCKKLNPCERNSLWVSPVSPSLLISPTEK